MAAGNGRQTGGALNDRIDAVAQALLEPRRMSMERAIRVATEMAARVRDFDFRFLQALESQPRSEDSVSRGLSILSKISDGRRLVQTLQRLVGSPQPAIRAQAALLAARAVQNRDWVSQRLNDLDPRVRANVVEGSWGWLRDRHILLDAVKDSNHRVACNALLRLHRLHAPETESLIEEFSNKQDPWFRVALAWMLGETLDPRVQPKLALLRNDPDPRVRWKALQSMRKIRLHMADTGDAMDRIRHNRFFLSQATTPVESDPVPGDASEGLP